MTLTHNGEEGRRDGWQREGEAIGKCEDRGTRGRGVGREGGGRPAADDIAAKMLRIIPDPKKNARDIFCGRSGYRLGFIRGPLGISLGIYPVAAREIAWELSGGRSGSS